MFEVTVSHITRFCGAPDSLDPVLVKDKIVFCYSLGSGYTQLGAGASGTIMGGNIFFLDVALTYPLPTSCVNLEDSDKVILYINSTK